MNIKNILAFTLILSSPFAMAEKQPNVLFIMVDDLRVQHGEYALDSILTPNIDALAKQGINFTRAYSNVPVCGASRASMLTGVRPTKSRFVAFNSAEKDAPWAKPMSAVFKENGYYTVSLGKVFNNKSDHSKSWSTAPWRPKEVKNEDAVSSSKNIHAILSRRDYLNPETQEKGKKSKKYHTAFESTDVADDAYKNGQIAKEAIQQLTIAKKEDKPFFLAVGLTKPHLPFNAPQKYWDLYKKSDIRLTQTPDFPKLAPESAYHNWGELRNYGHNGLMPDKNSKDLIPDDLARDLIHGYYAATSYSDALIGNILSELKALKLANNTIVVIWGDHGWSLGEHSLWAKHSPFNVANQIPLLIKVPNALRKDFELGHESKALVESVDIYPTLMELANLKAPSSLQGQSLVSLLKQPKSSVKDAIYYRWKNSDTIQTQRFSYTQWRNLKNNQVYSDMLYDHQNDKHETVNVVTDSKYKKTLLALKNNLKAHILTNE
jgi:iduronate 2-sulfatase